MIDVGVERPALCVPIDLQGVGANVLNAGAAFASGRTGRREGFAGF